MKMENKVICPEDVLLLLQPVEQIPDGATVSKRTGEQTFILRHTLKIGEYLAKNKEPLVVEGFFIISGSYVNQVAPGTALHWHVVAEDLVETLKDSWEPEEQ